jgi:type I restriction enzyme R subunit
MPIDHRERAFESAIEDHLLTCGGYTKADPAQFDRERALDPTTFLAFVRETQPEKRRALEALHGTETGTVVLDDLCKAMDARGSLDVLRHGFKCFGKQLEVAFFKPAHGLNPDTLRLYDANRLTITRQLRYGTKNENSIDLALSLNGIPFATAELKSVRTK